MNMEVATDVVDAVRDRLARRPGTLTPHRVAEALRETGRPVGDATVLAVHEALRRDVVGAGPLEPLLRTDGVTDVLVNGPDEVYLDRGAGLEPTDVRFRDDDSVRRLAQRLAAVGGRRLDDASPYADSRLPDGTRFHAVLSPVARPGTVVSLRVPRARGFSLSELIECGTVTDEGARLLRRVVVARGSRSSSVAARVPARPPCSRRCCPWCRPTSGSSSWRTRASSGRCIPMSSPSRRGLPTSRAPA